MIMIYYVTIHTSTGYNNSNMVSPNISLYRQRPNNSAREQIIIHKGIHRAINKLLPSLPPYLSSYLFTVPST